MGTVCVVGGSERAWRQLLSPGSHLEAPNASGMRINIRPDDSSLLVVGKLTHCLEYVLYNMFSTILTWAYGVIVQILLTALILKCQSLDCVTIIPAVTKRRISQDYSDRS